MPKILLQESSNSPQKAPRAQLAGFKRDRIPSARMRDMDPEGDYVNPNTLEDLPPTPRKRQPKGRRGPKKSRKQAVRPQSKRKADSPSQQENTFAVDPSATSERAQRSADQMIEDLLFSAEGLSAIDHAALTHSASYVEPEIDALERDALSNPEFLPGSEGLLSSTCRTLSALRDPAHDPINGSSYLFEPIKATRAKRIGIKHARSPQPSDDSFTGKIPAIEGLSERSTHIRQVDIDLPSEGEAIASEEQAVSPATPEIVNPFMLQDSSDDEVDIDKKSADLAYAEDDLPLSKCRRTQSSGTALRFFSPNPTFGTSPVERDGMRDELERYFQKIARDTTLSIHYESESTSSSESSSASSSSDLTH